MTNVYHVVTPGDHFSPRTGSAIPTVVHGLASGAAEAGDATRYPQVVVVQDGTMTPRYPSARAVTYEVVPAPTGGQVYLDLALGAMGLGRRAVRRFLAPIADVLRRQPPGVVIAHNLPVLPSLLRGSGHRTILFSHNELLRSYTPWEVSQVLGRTDRLVYVSSALAELESRHLSRHLRDRVRIVRNGVDAEQFHPRESREDGPLRIVFLGRALPMKGTDVLLKAAALLDRDDVEFLVIGSSNFDREADLTDYERLLRELAAKVTSPVSFEPFVERQSLPGLVQRADIVVLPSRWPDPCPLTVGEAMATGLPVVASRIGGIPASLGDAGVLVPPDDPRALAEALRDLIDDQSLRAELGRRARARAVEHDWTWSWRQLASVLDEL